VEKKPKYKSALAEPYLVKMEENLFLFGSAKAELLFLIVFH
jgi:hypothetical protein